MTAKEWLGICQILITLVGMYVGPKLAIHYSLRQFRSQKWWEKQEEAYRILLESLSIIRYYYGNCLDCLFTNSEYNPGEDAKTALTKARHVLEVYTATGAYLISAKAADALLGYYRDLNKADEHNRASVFNTIHDAAAKCIQVIRDEAKQNLA